MASKSTRPEGATEEERQSEQTLREIEALREKHKITRPIFAGVCAANDWRPGRAMTEEAFLQAVAAFTGASMSESAAKEGGHA